MSSLPQPDSVLPEPQPAAASRFLHLLAGVIAGAADLDPAAVLTATVAGASFGYSVGWVVLVTIPVLWAVFGVSSRIGILTRKGLVELVRIHHGRKWAFGLALAMVFVNATMIVGDVLAVSDALALILDLDKVFFIAAVAFSVWYLLISGNFNRTIRAMGVLSIALAAYIASAYVVTPSFTGLVHGVLLPKIYGSPGYALAVIALFGSLLTPDVIVWQTSSKRDLPPATTRQTLGGESHAGTFVACVISLSVVVAASQLRVADPQNMTTRMAAEALAPLGSVGPILFSIGVIGSGLVALPLLVASLCFSLAEAVGWKSGLSTAPWDARSFYVLICVTLLLATLIGYSSINPVRVLYWSQIVAGFLVVPILLLLLMFGNDKQLMRRRNSGFENFWLGAAVGAMAAANVVLLWTQFR